MPTVGGIIPASPRHPRCAFASCPGAAGADLPTAMPAPSRVLPRQSDRAVRGALAALLACVLCLPGCATEKAQPLLIAPMIHGVDLCAVAPGDPAPASERDLTAYCRASGRSAAGIIESTLAPLGPAARAGGRYEIGYTLPVPLLKLMVRDGPHWRIDAAAVERLALTVKESDRPVVLHLFSTHFGTKAPIEEHLAADPANLSVSPLGTMGKDRYYSIDIYPWSVASTDNDITRYRQQAVAQVVEAMCRLPAEHRRKIRAVTLLGEVHHFHADFEHGMGVGGAYVVSDYGQASVDGFRRFLAARFGEIGRLNRAVGGDFASFDQVSPPSRDIRTEPRRPLLEHIDSSAHGRLALNGWAFDRRAKPGEPAWIRIHRNGEFVARVPARYGRQDVRHARPDLGTADVGWRFDMDFTGLPPGMHRLDFLVERAGAPPASLGARRVIVMGADRQAPGAAAPPVKPPTAGDGSGVEGSIDFPPDLATVYFNPLVPLWHEFRNEQVVRYLAHFERQLRASCLGETALYTHQIAPFVNPGWDTTKFAADGSLARAGGLRLGISLYGEATYGDSFLDWLGTTSHRSYGITEFHPLRPMPPDEVAAMFERHRRGGAKFLSFFIDARPTGVREESERNIFAIGPDNRDFGSDSLYAAIRTVVNQ
jgi:hypothetical protein